MPTRMVHPDHGTTHAVGAEIEWNKKNGWKVEELPPKVAPVVEAKAEEAEEPVKKPTKPEVFVKRGRPPGK